MFPVYKDVHMQTSLQVLLSRSDAQVPSSGAHVTYTRVLKLRISFPQAGVHVASTKSIHENNATETDTDEQTVEARDKISEKFYAMF